VNLKGVCIKQLRAGDYVGVGFDPLPLCRSIIKHHPSSKQLSHRSRTQYLAPRGDSGTDLVPYDICDYNWVFGRSENRISIGRRPPLTSEIYKDWKVGSGPVRDTWHSKYNPLWLQWYDSDGRDSSVSIVTTGWAVLYYNPDGMKGLSFIKNFQFGSEAHTAPPPPPPPHKNRVFFGGV